MDSRINTLISRHLSGNTSPEEDKKIQEWISLSESNRQEFEKSRRIWQASLLLKKDRDADVDAAWNEFRQLAEKQPAAKPVQWFTPLRIAAGLALIAFLGIVLWVALPESASDQGKVALAVQVTEAVPTETSTVSDTFLIDEDRLLDSLLAPQAGGGGYKRKKKVVKNVVMITIVTTDSAKAFMLPDNSIVFLNDHSSLKYEESFGINNRKVSLTGEAYFEPVKDTMQLMVSCGKTITRSSHAFFNVREDFAKNEVEVIVVSGQAEFSGIGHNEYKRLVLLPGQRAICNKDELLSYAKVTNRDYKWWQKKNLRARLKKIFERIRNSFR